MYDLDDGAMLVTLEALLGVRDDGWRHLAHPLPFDTPGVEIEAVELDPSDPGPLGSARSSTSAEQHRPAPDGGADRQRLLGFGPA